MTCITLAVTARDRRERSWRVAVGFRGRPQLEHLALAGIVWLGTASWGRGRGQGGRLPNLTTGNRRAERTGTDRTAVFGANALIEGCHEQRN